jgi:hypothetical protein
MKVGPPGGLPARRLGAADAYRGEAGSSSWIVMVGALFPAVGDSIGKLDRGGDRGRRRGARVPDQRLRAARPRDHLVVALTAFAAIAIDRRDLR